MSRSGIPSVVFLQVVDAVTKQRKVIGTDAIFYVDGRWSRDTVASHAYERVADLRKRNPSYALAGYTVRGDYSGPDCAGTVRKF